MGSAAFPFPGGWDDPGAAPVQVPLRLYETTVGPQWVDYNGHMSEWCYLLVMGDSSDAFFRYIVSGMRNAVLAITRERMLALINDEAYRIFAVTPRRTDLGRPVADVLHEHPEVRASREIRERPDGEVCNEHGLREVPQQQT